MNDTTPPDVATPRTQADNPNDMVQLAAQNTATGPRTPTADSAVGGTLPPGLSVDPTTGIIPDTVTNSDSGNYSVTITAADTDGGTNDRQFQLAGHHLARA